MGETIHRGNGIEICAEATWGSPGYRDPAGAARRLVAIHSSGSRTEALQQVTMPFTVAT